MLTRHFAFSVLKRKEICFFVRVDARTDPVAVTFPPEQKRRFGALTRAGDDQAMLTALIILSLISLLVATEAEPTATPVPPRADPPLRPGKKTGRHSEAPKRDQIAA